MTGRAATCPGCGAPLALREEPAPRALDRDLTLDRRGGRPRATPPFWEAGPPEIVEPMPEPVPDAGGEPLDAGFDLLGPVEEEPLGNLEPEAPVPGETEPGHPRPPAPAPVPGETEPGRPRPPAPVPAAGETAPGRPQPPHPAPPAERPRARQVALPFPPEQRLLPAPAGRRLLAWGVDAGLAAGLAWLLTAGGAWLAGGADEAGLLPSAAALAALLYLAHATLGHALAGRTLGKWSAGLRLLGPDGRRPGPGRAAARALLSLAAAAPLGLGLWPALWDRQGRTIPDRIARTSVVRAP